MGFLTQVNICQGSKKSSDATIHSTYVDMSDTIIEKNWWLLKIDDKLNLPSIVSAWIDFTVMKMAANVRYIMIPIQK